MGPINAFRVSRVKPFRVSVKSRIVDTGGMAFRDRLRALRLQKGLTQQALADLCGFEYQSRIANYEAPASKAQARSPDVDELPLIARALGVGVDAFFTEDDVRHTPAQSVILDPAILAEAVRLMEAERILGIRREPESQANRLLELYQRIVADGGRLTVPHTADFMREIETLAGGSEQSREQEQASKRHRGPRR
jgi:transcriptional regulator with XRE-family HTH domain